MSRRRRPPAQIRAAQHQVAAVAAEQVAWAVFRLRRRCRWLTILSAVLAGTAVWGWLR